MPLIGNIFDKLPIFSQKNVFSELMNFSKQSVEDLPSYSTANGGFPTIRFYESQKNTNFLDCKEKSNLRDSSVRSVEKNQFAVADEGKCEKNYTSKTEKTFFINKLTFSPERSLGKNEFLKCNIKKLNERVNKFKIKKFLGAKYRGRQNKKSYIFNFIYKKTK